MREERKAMGMAMLVFGLCGFTTVLNTILIPYLRVQLALSYQSVALVDTVFYLGYFVFSPLSGAYFLTGGYLWGMRYGLLMGGLGTMGVALGGVCCSFSGLLGGIFLLGGGIAAIQVSMNPYVMEMGASETRARRLTFAQAFTSIGTVSSPLIGSLLIFAGMEEGGSGAEGLYGGLSFVWGLVFLFSFVICLPNGAPLEKKKEEGGVRVIPWLGMLGVALSVGTEVSTAAFLVALLMECGSSQISWEFAGELTSLFWLGLMTGRLLASLFLKRISASFLLFVHMIAGSAMCGLVLVGSGYLAVGAALSLGLCISTAFPLVFSLALSRSRASVHQTSGFLCMANIGGALFPLIQGCLADSWGVQMSFLLPFLGFVSLGGYAFFADREQFRNKLAVSV